MLFTSSGNNFVTGLLVLPVLVLILGSFCFQIVSGYYNRVFSIIVLCDSCIRTLINNLMSIFSSTWGLRDNEELSRVTRDIDNEISVELAVIEELI